MSDRALNARQVAELLGVHPNTVRRIPPAELPYFQVRDRGDRRYELADVDRYKAARRVEG